MAAVAELTIAEVCLRISRRVKSVSPSEDDGNPNAAQFHDRLILPHQDLLSRFSAS